MPGLGRFSTLCHYAACVAKAQGEARLHHLSKWLMGMGRRAETLLAALSRLARSPPQTTGWVPSWSADRHRIAGVVGTANT